MIIYAIPGLGTTEKLYMNTQIKGVEIIVLKWPVVDKNDTMQSYAKKFIPQINTTISFCLLGVSFGGMLCVELVKMISPQKTFLVSSCKTLKELPWFIKMLKYIPLFKIMNESFFRNMAFQSRFIIGFPREYNAEFIEMLSGMQENYFKYCTDMIINWNRKEIPNNIIHIHGNKDKLLEYKNVKSDYTINNGSHAMIVFKAEEINKIIEKEISLIH